MLPVTADGRTGAGNDKPMTGNKGSPVEKLHR